MEDNLRSAIRPGGTGPSSMRHMMYQDWASNAAIRLLAVYVVVVVVVCAGFGLLAFQAVMSDAQKKDFETAMIQLVIVCGAFGGVLQLCNSLAAFVGARKFLRSWLLFYYFRPLVGAGLGFVTYLVLRMGVLGTSPGPDSATAAPNFNVFGIMAFATMAGLFSRQALDKLAEVFDLIFTKVKKDIEKAETADLFLARGRTADDFSQRLPASLPPAQGVFGVEETTRG